MTSIGDLLVVDGHNDLAYALRELHGGEVDGFATGLPDLCTDLPRLRAGQVGAQFWAVFMSAEMTEAEATVAALRQLDLVRRLVERYPADLAWCTTADQAETARAEGKIASFAGLESGHAISSDLGVLRQLAALGIRYMTLTHVRNTPWAESANERAVTPGLTEFGREVVAEMNRIGVIVDIAHVSPATMHDVLATSTRPVITSHSSCHALCPNPRNIPDSVLAGIAASGGLAMITFVPAFISADYWEWQSELELTLGDELAGLGEAEQRVLLRAAAAAAPPPAVTISQVADHVDHARDVAGAAHVGLGGDFDGTLFFPEGLDDVSTYPRLLEELAARGWSHVELQALTWDNAMRVLRDTEVA
ncbi:MAG TPA: dipeptidase [Actinomycetaceae bacterium]|nr:dipeptidase [Actinomycetaceae bacterium]